MFTGGPNDTWRRIMRLSYIKISLLQITYPAQERLATSATGIYTISPTLFEQWCGFFYIPQEPDKWKCCEQDLQLYSFSSLSEKTRNCRCHCKGSNFFSVIYSEIRCIALCVLQTSKEFCFFLFRQSSLADLLGNTCLPARVQKVMVCGSWLVNFDSFCLFHVSRFVALWSSCFGQYTAS